MPPTTTTIDQHYPTDERATARRPLVDASPSESAGRSHPGAQRSVRDAHIALLQAELREVCDERDELRQRVLALEARQTELRAQTREALADQQRRVESSQQAIIQRYERVISEQHDAIEDASRGPDRGAIDHTAWRSVLGAVRDSLAALAR